MHSFLAAIWPLELTPGPGTRLGEGSKHAQARERVATGTHPREDKVRRAVLLSPRARTLLTLTCESRPVDLGLRGDETPMPKASD